MAETFYAGTDEIRMSAGKFRTSRQYLRLASSSALFVMAQTRTLNLSYHSAGALDQWRYSVDGYVKAYKLASSAQPTDTYNATAADVKL